MLMTRNEMSICYLGAYMSAMLNVLYCVMDLSAKVSHSLFLEYQVKCLFYSGCFFRCYSYASVLPLPFWLWIEIAALVTKTSPVVALQHLVILSFVQAKGKHFIIQADIAEMASQTSPVLPLFRLKVALMISYALEAEHFG
ncbi:uncharacterized protein A4U43_C03F2200 [Asparagus officinalis]|uniref:Uncharacterized protein n=1 Tax=Asparagus officinalis TaxID=4686 RepID=A0A5P1F8G9_ASPOF|nr:uncharacterized protein A4U43_C03F2200 [Asparagus officinalis]